MYNTDEIKIRLERDWHYEVMEQKTSKEKLK